MQRNKAYPEAGHGHGFSLQKLFQIPNFLKNTLSHDVGSLGVYQEAEIGVMNERREGVFIGKV